MNYKPTFYYAFVKGLSNICRQLAGAASLLLVAFLFFGFTIPKNTPPAADKVWVGTWGTARQLVEPNNMPPAPGLSNNTLRQVVCVSTGGKTLRLRFSNEFSKSPVTMHVVQIAVSKGSGTSLIDESTTKELKFNGKSEITMDAGGEAMSDPIAFNLEPRMEVAITISFGETSPTVTGHPGSRTTSFLLTGNHTEANTDFATAAKTDHWYVVTGIDVEASKAANATVGIIGDSITDGRGSGTNKQDRWPDILAMNLLKNPKTKTIGMLNMGIGGNCVLRGGLGPYALSRFDHDIMKQSGVKWLIVFEGVNDIGGTRDSTSAANVAKGLIEAFDKWITEAHAKGIKVYGATITPFKKAGYYSVFHEMARTTVNEWIRTSGHFDAVLDFDKVVRDPEDIATLLKDAQSGDYLHPNELGYQMMGNSIDLSLFK